MATRNVSPANSDVDVLNYSIYKYSSFSPNYQPCNIQIDRPSDQSSRWSSETNNPPQFIILKLSKFAIVKNITFGKYEKTHVCNLKKFKIYGGVDENHMIELLEGGLKNDSKPECFMLRYKVGGKPIACRYIKIVPIQSWGSSFNFTIWYIQLTGITRWPEVSEGLKWLTLHRENETVRCCLKFLRQMNYMQAFNSLKRETSVSLEHPAMSELFDIVKGGDFSSAERFMDDAIENGMLNHYISKLDYKPTWQNITAPQTLSRPGMRGGHQMCLDSYSETIYLLGGWDGHQDLSDMWTYHIPSNTWTLLSSDTVGDGGPSGRSCHKVCMDPEQRQIFVLGRYIDTQCRTPMNLKSDFYMYNIENNEWTKITDDTRAMGGPRLIFDHQMCMDTKTRTIYVFGGRVLTSCLPSSSEGAASTSEPIYSGLYSYHVPTNTWKELSTEYDTSILSRVGHSMLFHPVYRKLYIFAGQRNKEYLIDFFSYNVDTKAIEYLCEGCTKDCNNLPAAGFTQRATIDTNLDEIYVLSGLSKDKDKRDEHVQNSFWVYYIQQRKWSCIYKSETPNVQSWNKLNNIEPCPRFAHQLVYDSTSKVHYLFGGNPGMTYLPKLRLDDFWKLQLRRPSNFQLQRQCKILIRKCRFQELIFQDIETAMRYLQTDVQQVIDLNNADEQVMFSKLALLLFEDIAECQNIPREVYKLRAKLFDSLSAFFPENMTQPIFNLSDIVPL